MPNLSDCRKDGPAISDPDRAMRARSYREANDRFAEAMRGRWFSIRATPDGGRCRIARPETDLGAYQCSLP